MAQRGLEDWEIALIKRMMIEEYARDKMHAYFNRPDRTLTPAAYSEIKAGKFGTEIDPAAQGTLERFVEAFGQSRATAESDPLGAAELPRLLATANGGASLAAVEGDHLEFKSSFSFKENSFSKLLRAIAALANNAGGHIVCGVEDGSGRLLGMDCTDFNADLSRWSTLIKSALMPMPNFDRMQVSISNKSLGVIFVHESKNKPVCAIKKVGDQVRNGAIYYRYPAQSEEIGYGELSSLLRERDRHAREELLASLSIYNRRAPDEVAVIDLKDGSIENSPSKIKLSPEAISQLSIIKEGEFVEVGGAPAVRLIGDVESLPLEARSAEIVRGFVNDAAVLRNFVYDLDVVEPLQYFNAVVNSTADWLPLFRWVRKAGLTKALALQRINEEDLTPRKRERAINRVLGTRSAWLPLLKTYKAEHDLLISCGELSVETPHALRRATAAIRGLPSDLKPEQLACVRKAVRGAYDLAMAPGSSGDLISLVRGAASRVDEIENQAALS